MRATSCASTRCTKGRRGALLAGARRARPEDVERMGPGRPAAGSCPAPGAQVHLESGHERRLDGYGLRVTSYEYGTETQRADVASCVVLLSGGLDSYTAAAVLKAEGFDLFALSVRYGQRHVVELDAARAVAAALGVRRHLELAVDLSKVGGSALTADIDGAEGSRVRRVDSRHLRAREKYRVPLARAGVGRGAWDLRHRHRRQRARLLGLSRLPARIPACLRGDGQSGHQGRRRGPTASTSTRRCCR